MKLFEKIKAKKRQLMRFLFGSFSATALMFTFQACYGMPPEEQSSIFGVVLDAETQEPVEGISVYIEGVFMRDTTDHAGTFGDIEPVFVASGWSHYQAHLWDTDSTEHGLYEAQITTLSYEDLHAPIQLTVNRVHEDE